MVEQAKSAQGAESAYALGTRGDFRLHAAWLEHATNDADDATRAWGWALAAQLWAADPARGTPADHATLASFAPNSVEAQAGAAVACSEGARLALVYGDVTEFCRWAELQSRFSQGIDWPLVSAHRELLDAWTVFVDGELERAAQMAAAIASSSVERLAFAPIEAEIISAYCAELNGEVDMAVRKTREAWRRARAEDLPQWQYLASLALARMRRVSGAPHLAARILRPLAEVAPSPWQGAIAWEAWMAGALTLGASIALDDQSDPMMQSRTLGRMLLAAANAQRNEFDAALAELVAMSGLWPTRARDRHAGAAALSVDHTIDAERQPAVAAWVAATQASPPGAVKGFCVDLESNPDEVGPAASVIGYPPGTGTARRIAALGESVAPVDARIPRVRGKSERDLRTLAALACAGPAGMEREALFQAVYGFKYDHELHRTLLNGLVFRVRQALGDRGELSVTDEQTYVLELNCVLLIPDPRCEQSLEDVVLRAMSRSGALSAKEASSESGVALRTAQRALRQLVEEGALTSERKGRQIMYRLEDTTFSEPTKW